MAKIAEQEGFDSLWVFERLLWPLKPQTPYPATAESVFDTDVSLSTDCSLPTFYQTVFDPWRPFRLQRQIQVKLH